jgi:MFS superfamily sulfate permease-like transporter
MVVALGIAAVLTVMFRPILPWRMAAIAGLAFAMGHYHGREKRDYEVSVQMPPPQLESFYFWHWSWDQTTDYWPTAILCTLLIWLVARKLR